MTATQQDKDAIRERINDLVASAEFNHTTACMYEDKANARVRYLREELRYIHHVRARAGNPISQRIIQPGYERDFETLVDDRASLDPQWNGFVSNNKFYTRKANLDNQMVQTLIQRLEMMERGGE